MKLRWRLSAQALLASFAPLVAAAHAASQEGAAVILLPQPCEVSWALSAEPANLRFEPTVYALTQGDFSIVRRETNSFTCLVNRDHPFVLKPTCFGEEAGERIVPGIIEFGNQLVEGVPAKEARTAWLNKFETGEYEVIRRPGVACMQSRYNRAVEPVTGKLGFFPPYVIYNAPKLTTDDIGHDHRCTRMEQPTPIIGYEGPHGYMIQISDDGAPRKRSDLHASCPAWIWES